MIVLDGLHSQLAQENCYIFHGFETGLDGDVVRTFCDKLKASLHNADIDQLLICDRKLRKLANLAGIDWASIQMTKCDSSDEHKVSTKRGQMYNFISWMLMKLVNLTGIDWPFIQMTKYDSSNEQKVSTERGQKHDGPRWLGSHP